MKPEYLYGKQPAEIEPAAGVKGVLIRSPNGAVSFRVYHDKDKEYFTDYDIRHDDLEVTIAEDELAAFYKACPRAGGDGEHLSIRASLPSI